MYNADIFLACPYLESCSLPRINDRPYDISSVKPLYATTARDPLVLGAVSSFGLVKKLEPRLEVLESTLNPNSERLYSSR